MAVKPSKQAGSSKRTTAGSSAKASTTGAKPTSPRTRVQKVQEVVAVPITVDENIVDPSTAMDVVPRYVRVPFGRTNRLNYQQARASAARKNCLSQPPATPTPTAMNRPPLTIFDAPTKVVLPAVPRSPTQSDMDVPTNNPGAETDKEEETDPETPREEFHQLPSGEATDTEDVDESNNADETNVPSFLSFVAGLDGDTTDVEEASIHSSPTPAPRRIQRESPLHSTAISPAPQSDNLGSPSQGPSATSEQQTPTGGCSDNTSTYQNPTVDIWNTGHAEGLPLSVNTCSNSLSHPPSHQWNVPEAPPCVPEQPSLFPASFQPPTTTRPLVRTGTDFGLVVRINQLSVEAAALPNNFGEYAQLNPDAAAVPVMSIQALNSSAPVGQFYYETPPPAASIIPPIAPIWPQDLGLYCSAPASFQSCAGAPTLSKSQEYRLREPLGTKLFQLAPASCLPNRRDRPHPPSIRTKIYDDPQPEWQAKMKDLGERKSLELTQSLNPFRNMIGPCRWDYSGGKCGLLYVFKPGEEEPRKCSPLPARAQTKRVPRPAKGSEEDLIERIKYQRRLEAREARCTAMKAEKQMERARLEAKGTRRIEMKADKLTRRRVKRDQRSSDEEGSASSERSTKRRKKPSK